MQFPTLEFGAFFILVFYISWELYFYTTIRKVFLLVASYFFYATLDLKFLPLIIISPVLNFFFGLWIGVEENPKVKKAVLIFTVSCNLLLLGVFKYYDFFVENIINLLSSWPLNLSPELIGSQLPFLNLILPLGISFFTFQGISYLVDIYRGELSYKNSILDVMLFISFFPHLVAGPIVKANEFIPQLKNKVDPHKIPIFYALSLIVMGLFKKVIIANYLGTNVVDPVFENPSLYSSVDVLFAVYAYAVQIFCDFSAYSDMAIAFAALLGYEFPLNFDQPYRASSLQDFWRRWHISLSSWLRDYLYKPLGGSRGTEKQTYRNLFITMFLGGIWHGASWNFIFWGSLHGLGLSAERYFKLFKNAEESLWKKWLARILTFHFVSFVWIFFRSPSFDKTLELLKQFADFNSPIKIFNHFYFLLILIGMSFHFFLPLRYWRLPAFILKRPRVAFVLGVSLLLTVISTFSPDGISPFIYFRF